MMSLLQSYKKIINLLKNFKRLKLGNKILIIRVLILTALMRSAMLIIPFKRLRKYMGELNKESSSNLSDDEYRIAQRISWSINKVVKYTPWESKCLVQALTAQYLLSCSNIENTIYLGVTRENNIRMQKEYINNLQENKGSNLVAHSWIRCGSYYVTGGNGNNFKIVAKFAK